MATAYKTNNEQLGAISRRQQLISAEASAGAKAISSKGESDLRDVQKELYGLQQKQLDNARQDNIFNFTLNMANLVVDTASSAYNIIVQDQLTKKNLENQKAMEEGKRLMTASRYEGTSYWGTGEDGKAQFIVSPEVQQWAESHKEKINSSNGLNSVKKSQLDSFDMLYESLITQGMEDAIKQSYQDLNTNFTQILDGNFKDDVASYVAAGGDLSAWGESNPLMGVATIASRLDWSTDLRSAKSYEYIEKVRAQGDIEIASQIALSEGNQAAWDWIYSKDRGYMTEQERQQAYTTASKAVSLRAGSVSQQATDFMEDALTNPESSMTASDVYHEISLMYEGEAPEVIAKAVDSAKAKHKEIMTAAGNNQFNADKEAGLDALTDTYTRLMGGEFDGNYINIEDSKATLAKTYKAEIERQEKELGIELSKTPAQIRSGNTKLFQTYQESQKGVLLNFDSGEIDGYTAVTQYMANYEAIEEELEGDESEKGYWGQKKANLLSTFTEKILNKYIPSKYSTQVSGGKSTLTTAIKAAYAQRSNTDGMQTAIQDMQTYYNGFVADWMFENGGSATAEEVNDFCQRTGNTISILSLESDDWFKIGNGTAINTKNATTALKGFNEVNKLAWSTDDDSYLFYYDSTAAVRDYLKTGKPFDPSIVFATPGMEQTFEQMKAEVSTQVCYYLGLNDDASHNAFMATACPTFDEEGQMNFSPMVFDASGNFYCIKDKNIMIAKAGEDGMPGTWMKTGATTSVTAEKMKNKAEGSATAPVLETADPNKIAVPGSKSYDDAWAAGMARQQASDATKNRLGLNVTPSEVRMEIGDDPIFLSMLDAAHKGDWGKIDSLYSEAVSRKDTTPRLNNIWKKNVEILKDTYLYGDGTEDDED